MFAVIKLGGCNGSGKTTLARSVLAAIDGTGSWFSGARKSPNVYVGKYQGVEALVLGSYETTCGGMDTISDKLERLKLLRWACKPNRIIFYEGLITGKTYGAMGGMCAAQEEAGTGRWIWAFMDTSFERCVSRVLDRRHAKGNYAPFEPQRTMQSTYDGCMRLEQKLRDGTLPAPHMVYSVNGAGKPEKEAAKLLDLAVEALR